MKLGEGEDLYRLHGQKQVSLFMTLYNLKLNK